MFDKCWALGLTLAGAGSLLIRPGGFILAMKWARMGVILRF